jgi:RNA polymerase sigma-70 factor (ECF subfamily)
MGQRLPFEQAWSKDHRKLYRFALKLTLNSEEAEDLLQISRIKAWRFYEQFDGNSAFSTWVMRITTRAFMDIRKSPHGRQTFVSMDETLKTEDSEASFTDVIPDPHASFEDDVLSGITIQRFLDQIFEPEDRDRALWLFCGRTYEEIASFERIPVGTVRSRIHRTRERIRQQFGKTLDLTLGVSL